MTIDPCTEYGLALAAEDFVPVVLAGAGAVILARACGSRHPSTRLPALAGALLITLGGFSKALWKLLVASEPCRDIAVLEQVLFPFLSFGFAALAWSVVSLRRETPAAPWPYLVVPVVGAGSAVALESMAPLLAVAALGAVWMGLNAAAHARRRGWYRVVGLFAFYLLGTLVLPPLSAREHQSEGLQWVEQATNSLVQLAFVLGSLELLRRTAASEPEPSSNTSGAST